MSAENINQSELLKEHIELLVKVGVGGGRFENKEDYLAKIEQELMHEEGMMRGGLAQYNKTVTESKIKGQESTTMYGLVQQQKYLSKLSQGINEKIERINKGEAGRNQIATKLICQCLPASAFDEKGEFKTGNPDVWDVCSLIVLKNVIDGISSDTTMNKLAIKIGGAMMMEARITLFKDQHRDKYNQVNKRLGNNSNHPQKTNRYAYKKNVWVYCMNKHDLRFDAWTKENILHLGVFMVYLCQQLGLVECKHKTIQKHKTILYVLPSNKIIHEIANFNIKNEMLYPKYLPMLMPPRKWGTPFDGGYYGRKHNFQNKKEEVAQSLNKGDK